MIVGGLSFFEMLFVFTFADASGCERHGQCSVSGQFPNPLGFYEDVETYTYEGHDDLCIFELKLEDQKSFFGDWMEIDGDTPSEFIFNDYPGAELTKIEVAVRMPSFEDDQVTVSFS